MGIRSHQLLLLLLAFTISTTLLLVLSIHVFPDQVADFSGEVMVESERWILGETVSTKERLLRKNGYYIHKGDVAFQFINPVEKVGTPEEMNYLNMERFADISGKEILEPLDYDIESIRSPENPDGYERASATIVALARNEDFDELAKTILSFEKMFNAKFQYPYTFLNDGTFSDNFKKGMQALSKAQMEFVTIPESLWQMPPHIDKKKAKQQMNKLSKSGIKYSKDFSVNNMLRFFSGNFYHVPEMKKYRYYWRIEPKVSFFTELKYDVFKYLQGTGKLYGFSISLYDNPLTVETLWPETMGFLNEGSNFQYVNKKGSFQWLTENQQLPGVNAKANGYSTCHFWSNFEIGDMNFFRGEAYSLWFQHLDTTNKFYYERWGDAPVHSIGLGLFADKSKIHWFRDIGYFHYPYYNCPKAENTRGCLPGQFSESLELQDRNCLQNWIDYSIDNLNKIY
ncbi:uncharacterized protein KQ657_001172 [Scheffersomyces spartinae]|uniref:Mannosyltransferase n=1 Tax=Scheffersomyces spartinae TaxID=45513 RepID=A0A9P7V861_9ASCO|nr:uncharacterized protein KQ657_001172 [Scheffersomyces spartinae]KAG7193055.1 hypothetical protein KQ657_001172 [Scheffersomyces spartinae]